MKRAIVYLLRVLVVLGLLLPALIPTVKRSQNFQSPATVTVFIPAGVELAPIWQATFQTRLKDRFGSDSVFRVTRFGRLNSHPVSLFEELGNSIQNTDGEIVVCAPTKLWGPATRKFIGAYKQTEAFKQGRLHWITPELRDASAEPSEFVALSEIFIPSLSFLGEESIANIEVLGKASPGSEIDAEIVIRTGDSLLTSKVVRLKANEKGYIQSIENIPLTFVRAGTQLLSAEISSPLASAPLNSVSTTVSVTHSKATLLHIAVGPDWSLRNLRQKLKFWPNLDLLSYYILREFSDDMTIPSSQLSLIEFPTDKLFGSELPNFHGIIAQNFPLDHYLNPKEAENLVGYVRDGGRLAIVAGPLSFESQDPNILSISPCTSRTTFDTEHSYSWEPGDVELSGDEKFKDSIKNITTHATAIGCEPKKGAIVLARTEDGKHPTLLAMPVEKGLVLAILAGDWHTSTNRTEFKGEGDRARAVQASRAVEGLFQWTVEFLQRRQDSGLRPPDFVGPRLYEQDSLLVVRSRGLGVLDRDVSLMSEGKLLARGQTKHLPFLDLDVVTLDDTLAKSIVSFSRELSTSLPLHLGFDENESLRARAVTWPLLAGSTAAQENLANPLFELEIEELSTASLSAQNTVNRNVELEAPLLEAYPWLLALALSLLALEQFLSHILWREQFSKKEAPNG